MNDFTKCHNNDCELRKSCKRFRTRWDIESGNKSKRFEPEMGDCENYVEVE